MVISVCLLGYNDSCPYEEDYNSQGLSELDYVGNPLTYHNHYYTKALCIQMDKHWLKSIYNCRKTTLFIYILKNPFQKGMSQYKKPTNASIK